MFKRTIFVVLMLIIFSGCWHLNDKTIVQSPEIDYYINVASCIDLKSEILISEISSEVFYIPLETSINSLIRHILKVICTEHFIFVADENGLYQFTFDGKFVQQIGNLGRGPGEHSTIMNFIVDDKANIIIVQGQSSTVQYDLEGNYVKNLKRLPGLKFEFLNHDAIVFYKPNHTESPKNLIITSLNLIPIKEFINRNPRPKTNPSFLHAPLYLFNEHLYFKENFNDTVFCLQDSILAPYILINEKELRLDKCFELKTTGDYSDLIMQLDRVEDKLLTHNILECEKYVFISYIQGMNPRSQRYVNFIFDKQDKNTFCLKNGEFFNDVDGGMNFYPTLRFDDNTLAMQIDALKLKRYVNSEGFRATSVLHPEKKKELEDLANSLSESDNPVLMVVRMK
jgi:hypothetical protein